MLIKESGFRGHKHKSYEVDMSRSRNLNKGRVVIMAEYPIEKTTDVPEHAFLAVRHQI